MSETKLALADFGRSAARGSSCVVRSPRRESAHILDGIFDQLDRAER